MTPADGIFTPGARLPEFGLADGRPSEGRTSRLIGIVGAAGSGKTTLARLLVRDHGYSRHHMGQPIKEMLTVLGLSDDQLRGAPEARAQPVPLLGGRSARHAMQTLGTQWGRDMISPDIWANAVRKRLVEHLRRSGSTAVVDDVRFPNDWRMIVGLGGTLVRVVRPGVSRARSLADRVAHHAPVLRVALQAVGLRPVHGSEYHWRDAPADVEITNAGDPEEMMRKLRVALSLC